jgi:hypothetical protein
VRRAQRLRRGLPGRVSSSHMLVSAYDKLATVWAPLVAARYLASACGRVRNWSAPAARRVVWSAWRVWCGQRLLLGGFGQRLWPEA